MVTGICRKALGKPLLGILVFGGVSGSDRIVAMEYNASGLCLPVLVRFRPCRVLSFPRPFLLPWSSPSVRTPHLARRIHNAEVNSVLLEHVRERRIERDGGGCLSDDTICFPPRSLT